jgi:hypothetical protein
MEKPHAGHGHEKNKESIKPKSFEDVEKECIEALINMGNKTGETIDTVLFNTFLRPFTKREDRNGHEHTQPIRQTIFGILGSIGSISMLVGAILIAGHKTSMYGGRVMTDKIVPLLKDPMNTKGGQKHAKQSFSPSDALMKLFGRISGRGKSTKAAPATAHHGH